MPASSPEESIVLDTNVVSELMLPDPDPGVVAWVAAQNGPDVYLTAITTAELWRGAGGKDKGKRRDLLMADINTMIEDYFGGRVLPFDKQAAHMLAAVAADRRANRLAVPHFADCAIAAIARQNNAAVATRNTHDFVGGGIEVIDPWAEASPPKN